MIDGRKVSANAFYHIPGRSIVHGTMLFDVDAATMSRAITPSRAKLESKRVQSVPARITCLRAEGIDMDVDAFGRYAIGRICGDNTYQVGGLNCMPSRLWSRLITSPNFYRGDVRRNMRGPTSWSSVGRAA